MGDVIVVYIMAIIITKIITIGFIANMCGSPCPEYVRVWFLHRARNSDVVGLFDLRHRLYMYISTWVTS